jgi:formylglycine-generating enzyme
MAERGENGVPTTTGTARASSGSEGGLGPAPPAAAVPFARWRCAGDGLEYVHLPQGEFWMGADPEDRDADENEKPRHLVQVVRGFWLARVPVTVVAYKHFCDATGRVMPRAPVCNPGWRLEDHPIVNLTWNEAVEFCRWAGARLPTEAEWEYAARGGTDARYWWGSEIEDSKLWYRASSVGGTHPVAAKPPNPWGLSDILGSVWEWCADPWHASYVGAPSTAGVWEGPEGMHALRGGSSVNTASGVRVTYRAGFPDVVATAYCGFRCVRDPR